MNAVLLVKHNKMRHLHSVKQSLGINKPSFLCISLCANLILKLMQPASQGLLLCQTICTSLPANAPNPSQAHEQRAKAGVTFSWGLPQHGQLMRAREPTNMAWNTHSPATHTQAVVPTMWFRLCRSKTETFPAGRKSIRQSAEGSEIACKWVLLRRGGESIKSPGLILQASSTLWGLFLRLVAHLHNTYWTPVAVWTAVSVSVASVPRLTIWCQHGTAALCADHVLEVRQLKICSAHLSYLMCCTLTDQ